MSEADYSRLRDEMLEQQIVSRGLSCAAVIDAMRAIPRERFVPTALQSLAYADRPLPIAEHQTISQPYMVALMADELRLRGDESVLEIGTGSGYAAAVLGRLARQVCTVERLGGLAESAAHRLAALGCANVQVHQGDGSLGWPAGAPYDAILVSAGAPRVPPALAQQLRLGGRMVIPVGADSACQQLLRVTRRSVDDFETETIASVWFVPLLGEQGWDR